MKVWIVEAGLDYEPGAIIAVRSSEERAEEVADKLRKGGIERYDWVFVSGHTVDEGTPEVRFRDYT